MASRRGQILLAVLYSMRILPTRLTTASTQVPFQLKDFAFLLKWEKVKKRNLKSQQKLRKIPITGLMEKRN